MERVLFGESSSPFLCISAIHKHADDHVTIFGEDFRDSIKENLYMDDVHEGGMTKNEVVEKYHRLIRVFLLRRMEPHQICLRFASRN